METQQRNKTKKTYFIKLTGFGLKTSLSAYTNTTACWAGRYSGSKPDPNTDGFNEVAETPKHGMWDSSLQRPRLVWTSLFLLLARRVTAAISFSVCSVFFTLCDLKKLTRVTGKSALLARGPNLMKRSHSHSHFRLLPHYRCCVDDQFRVDWVTNSQIIL